MSRFLLFSLAVLVMLSPLQEGHAQALNDMADALVELSAPVTEQAGKRTVHRLASGRVETTYNGVVVQGFAGGDSLKGWVRFDAAGGWGDWQPLYIVRSATDAAFLAAYRGATYRTDPAFELRFEVDAGQDVHMVGAGVFDNRRDAERQAPETDAMPPSVFPDQTSDFLIVAPDLIPRASWGAEPFRGDLAPLNRPDYRHITFHHAAGFGATTLEEGREQVKRIQDFHQNGRGWSDIGYQFVMDQSGRLYQGRPFWDENVPFDEGPRLALGAHAGGANTGNIGVCVLGCYHPPEGVSCQDQMTDAALDSLITMFAFLSERYAVSPASIRGHRDFSSTACPGDSNYPLLPSIREQTDALLHPEDQVAPPDMYVFMHGFPNPFRQNTTLQYYLVRDGIVRLTVYDVLGRAVTSLVDEFQDGGRWYTVPFDGSGLSSGSYFARLQVEGFSGIVFDKTRSLALVK